MPSQHFARENLAANVVLASKDNPMGLSAQLARTVLGQLRGSIGLATPERRKHVGIFFDVKCSGEASRRPHVRAPLRMGRSDTVTVAGGCPCTLGAVGRR